MKKYSTSILYGSDPILLEFISFDDVNLSYKKWTSPFGITSDEVVIPIKYIRKIQIKNELLGSKIEIKFFHMFHGVDETVIGKYFKKSDAKEIKNILLS